MSTAAIPVQVALVDVSRSIATSELVRVAGALSEQVQADFAPVWHVRASVVVDPEPGIGTWRVNLRDGIDDDQAAGFHLGDGLQPHAEVDLNKGDWRVTASHELLEMLGDPWGNRLHAASAPPGWPGASPRVRYLLELCDPCEASSYAVGGVEVSDFVTPAFYRSARRAGGGFSHAGAVTGPLEVADGGYLSFLDPADGHVWQRHVHDGGRVEDRDWGVQDLGRDMLRERSDELARRLRGGA
jgi:hypothetical protein